MFLPIRLLLYRRRSVIPTHPVYMTVYYALASAEGTCNITLRRHHRDDNV